MSLIVMRVCIMLILLSSALMVNLGGCGRQSVTLYKTAPLQTYSDEPYKELLNEVVIDGNVDYTKLRESQLPNLTQYVESLGRFGPSITPKYFQNQDDELAYYLNAYNAIMLYLWISKGAGQGEFAERHVSVDWFFTHQYRVDGQWMSLDHLEQRLIIPRFKEPRIHFALVCGAISCPPLLEEPFNGSALDQQLESLGIRWLTEADGLTVEDNQVKPSSIFSWYRGDFESMGGLAGMFDRYLDEKDTRREAAIRAAKDNQLNFQHYSWRINQVPETE